MRGSRLLNHTADESQHELASTDNCTSCANPNLWPKAIVNAERTRDMPDLPKREPNTPMISFPTYLDSKSSG